MTSKQVMLSRPGAIRVTGCVLLIAASWVAGGCARKITQPHELTSPYPAAKLWAVAPMRNESGTSLVDGAAMADKLTQQLAQVKGITTLPVNRVIEAMGAMGLRGPIETPEQALALMQVLDADGLLVGTVTAWDPYSPMKIGVTVQLYSRAARGSAAEIDPHKLRRAATPGDELPGLTIYRQPVAEAGGYYDAANGRVLQQLQTYATGRAPDDSPAGWRRYLLNMDLYAEFVSHELTRELFRDEWERMTTWQSQTAAAHAADANSPPANQRP